MPVKPGVKPLKKLTKGMGLYQVMKKSGGPAGKPWAVVNLQTGDVNGRWHASQAEAAAQARALYARLGNKARFGMNEPSCIVAFTENAVEEDGLLWLEALPAKVWFDPRYGEVPITEEKLNNFIQNFNEGVRGQEVMTDYEHGLDPAKGRKASGTYRKFDIRPRDDGTVSLWAGIDPTATALDEIKKKEWKYFSLEWEDEWTHPETQLVHKDVVVGGGFTNRPVAKGMMPINFSEVFVEVAEVSPEEHQEPGTLAPDPRINEDDSFPNRIETPAPGEDGTVPSRPVTGAPNSEGGESVMTEEQLKELRTALGLDADADADKVLATVTSMSEELQPLRELRASTESKKKFAEEYPEEANRLALLEQRDQESFAKAFSESFVSARITNKIGEGDEVKDEPTTLGFSGRVINEIQTVAKQFSEGKPTFEGFKTVLDAVIDNGIVDYGDKGSEREHVNDDDEITPAAGSKDARAKFAEKVEKIMENDEVDFNTALSTAAKLHPKLAEAWRQPPVAA